MTAVDSIIEIQAALMDAFDAHDIVRIEQSIKDLARAVALVRQRGVILALMWAMP